jgi:acetyl esterase/lipase
VTRRSFLAAAAASAGALWGQETGRYYAPSGPSPHPTVLFIPGEFWKDSGVGRDDNFCKALARAGAAVWSLPYPRIGDPGATWAVIAEDVVKGAQRLISLEARYSLDLTRLVAVGHAGGGHLALWLAAQRVVDLRGVIGLAAISDLQLGSGVVRELLGGTPDQIPQRYAAASPMELLPISVPQRLVHGTADKVIPFEMSERFAKASGNAKLIPLDGAGHFDLIDPNSRFWPTIQRTILDWPF